MRTLPAVPGASGIAAGFGRLWVVSPPSAKVVALDPVSGRLVDEIGVGVDPAAIAVGADAVWVTNRADGTVSKIEPRTGAVIGTTAVGRGPTGIAAGPDAVWVANAGDGTLSEVDPATVKVVKSVPLGNPPRDVVRTPDGVYVTVGSNGSEHRGGNLRVASVELDFIDPALAYTGVTWSMLTMTNDGLVAFRRVGGVQGIQLVPDLAISLPILTEGGKAYTFQLRRGIRYSNGTLVQPADFRRAIERALELGSPGALLYTSIVGADRCRKGKRCDLSRGIVTDREARTVTFKLTAADGDFLSKLALPFAFAVPVSTPSHPVGTDPVPATGPYRIATYRKKAKVLRLLRNPRFREWSSDAQPRGFPDAITISWAYGLTDTSSRVRAVKRGDADITPLGQGPPLAKEEFVQLAAQYPAQLHFSTAFNTEYFFLNTRIPPFDDVSVRRAVNNAFDAQAFTASEGVEYSPTCRILPPNFPGYEPSCLYASGGIHGIDRARQQVKRAGAAGAHVTVWTLSRIRQRGEYMASLLRSIGFRADVKAITPGAPGPISYFSAVADPRNRAQIGFGGWGADYPSAAGFIPPLLSCAGYVPTSPEMSSNLSGFCDPSIDAKMARATALQATNPPAGTLLWQQIERELLAQAPLVPTDNRRSGISSPNESQLPVQPAMGSPSQPTLGQVNRRPHFAACHAE
jgi:YVTN family beta-propeller protein